MKKLTAFILVIFTFITFSPYISADSNAHLKWTKVDKVLPWQGRFDHGLVDFKGKLWLLGGRGEYTSYYNDIWNSADGMNWKKVDKVIPWTSRHGFPAVVFKDKIWVLGGAGEYGANYNDVWYSEDGENWKKVDKIIPWTGRTDFRALVFNSKMWIMGGYGDNGTYFNDVWYSEDGITWKEAQLKGKRWEGREEFGAVVFDGKMWITGGLGQDYKYGDVWYSVNGSEWTEANSDTYFKYGQNMMEYDDLLWMIGGGGESIWEYPNTIYYSADGANWYPEDSITPWKSRTYQAATIFNGKIWMIGGLSEYESYLNEIWYAEPITKAVTSEPKTTDTTVSDNSEKEQSPTTTTASAKSTTDASSFKDVTVSNKYAAAIQYLNDNKIVGGYSDGTFKPKNTINRAEFMKIVTGAAGLKSEGGSCFPDVKDEWFAPYICAGSKKDIVKGYPDGTFRPSKNINVVEALKITFNAFGISTPDSAGAWYQPYVDYAENNDLMLDSFKDLTKNVTREEMAELVYRIMKK